MTLLIVQKAKEAIENYFVDANVKTAALNIMDKSFCSIDYCLYENTMLKGPWSNDSKEHNAYMKTYEEWSKKQ